MTYIGNLSTTALGALTDDINARNGGFVFAAAYGVSSSNTDNSDAFDALLAALQRGQIVVLPHGRLQVSRTIAWPLGVRVMGGQPAGNNFNGTEIAGTTAGMTIMTTSSFTLLESFGIDGDHVAGIGLYAGTSNRCSISRVEVKQCTEYGLVLSTTQNSLLVDCMARDCKINYALINGASFCHLMHCQSDQFADVYGTAARALFIGSVSDGRFTSASTANRHNRFVGGIYERGTSDPQVEIAGAEGVTTFDGMSIQGNGSAIVSVNSSTATVLFRDVFFSLSGSDPADRAVAVSAGTVLVDNPVATGTSNTHVMQLFATSGAGVVRFATYDAATPWTTYTGLAFDGTAHGWTAHGGASVAHNATKKRLEITSASNSQEVRPPLPNASGFSPGQYRVVRVRFGIQNITGGTTVRLQTSLGASPWRRSHGDFAAGYHEVYVELQGDEFNFSLAASSAVSTTAELVYFHADIVSAL